MKNIRITCILLTSVILFSPGIFIEASSEFDDREQEEKYYQLLKEKSKEAAELFRDAGEALAKKELGTAESNYRKVISLVPDFSPALRRLSYITANELEAMELAFKAIRLDKHPDNKKAVALALIRPNIRYYTFAQPFAKAAADEMPKDAKIQSLLCHISFINKDFLTFKQALSRLKQLEPEEVLTHYYLAKEAVVDKRWTDAEAELLRARQLGLSAEAADELSTAFGIRYHVIRSRLLLYLPAVLWIFGIWIGFMLVLLAVGKLLSWLTLTFMKRYDPIKNKDISPGEKRTRSIYSVVLVLTFIYFYISLPMLVLLVIVIGGVIILSIPYMSQSFVISVIFIGIVTAALIWMMLKCFFIRHRIERKDHGPQLEESSAPLFFELLQEVSQKIGTVQVDKVFVTPGPIICVYERGSLWKHLRGTTEKCLDLGAGAMKGLTRMQLKALLAHELVHLNISDYQADLLAHHVILKVNSFMKSLDAGGMNIIFNPLWLFLKSFYPILMQISQGASRIEEIMADRIAVLNYGIKSFIQGFRQIIRRYIEFELISLIEITQAEREERQVRNLYRLKTPGRWPQHFLQEWKQMLKHWAQQWPEQIPKKAKKKTLTRMLDRELDEEIQAISPFRLVEELYYESFNNASTPTDSHPSPKERIRYMMGLGHQVDIRDNKEQAWTLFNFSNVFLKNLSSLLQGKKKKELKKFITRIITNSVMSNRE